MLRTRVISAVIMAPLFLAAVYYYWPWFYVMFGVIGVLMGWEWTRIVNKGKFGPSGWIMSATLGLIVALLAAHHAPRAVLPYGIMPYLDIIPLVLIVVSTTLIGFVERRNSVRLFWQTIGMLYLGVALYALVMILQSSASGWKLFYWLLAVVWATDIGAYFAGRAIGGPKLAPAISPNKTWAGLVGGMICAALGGWLTLFVMHAADLIYINVMNPNAALGVLISGAFLAIVAQGGDLFESFLKRRFGVKDSSHIIPGHGGVLDRFDGLLAAGLFTLVVPTVLVLS